MPDFKQDYLPDSPPQQTNIEMSGVDSVLKTGSFKSPNFVSGKKGWELESDGGATFRNLTISGAMKTVPLGGDIQSAINYLYASGGGQVRLSAGTYNLAGNLDLYSGVQLVGSGSDATIINFGFASNGIRVIGTNAYSTGTISITSGDTAITGSGTTFTAAMAGRSILLEGIWYPIASFSSTTSITISIAYGGSTLSGASYKIATTKNDIKITDLSIYYSASAGVKSQYTSEFFMRDVNLVGCTIGLDADDSSNTTIEGCDGAVCGTTLDYNNVHYFNIDYSGSVDASSTGYIFSGCTSGAVNDNFILKSGAGGVSITNCDDINFKAATAKNNTGKGFEAVSGNTNIVWTACGAIGNTSDGIKLTATSDRCSIVEGIIEDNGGYGINIAASTCDGTIIGANQYNNNSSGNVNDAGTGTKTLAYTSDITGVAYKNGVITRAMDAASGAVTTAHGLGVIPKKVRITATLFNVNAEPISFGSYDGTNNSCVWHCRLTGSAGNSTSVIVYLLEIAGKSQEAVATVDATNITLTWTRTGATAAGTANIMWEAEG